jgi:hypothetical protein
MGERQSPNAKIEKSNSTGRFTVLFPDIGITATAFFQEEAIRSQDPFQREMIVQRCINEYSAILRSLYVASEGQITLTKTPIFGVNLSQGSLTWKELEVPALDIDLPTIDLQSRSYNPEKSVVRDLFTDFSNTNGELVFIDSSIVPKLRDTDTLRKSPLGEGGKVLRAGLSVLISEDLWSRRDLEPDLRRIKRLGYKVAPVPWVNPSCRPGVEEQLVPGHIDGHISLIEGIDGKTYMLFLDSYENQDEKTEDQLRQAAEFLGVVPVRVEDKGLPPLPLNILQLPNNNVVLSRGFQSESHLEQVLATIVGADRLFITKVPLQLIPHHTKAGIRCLTNVANPKMIERIHSLV